MSKLLMRLKRELDACSDSFTRAELMARISCNFARIGNFVDAKQCIADLRRDYAGEKSGPATVWIMLAEGLLHLFSDLNPLALDRVSRAQILGLAMKYPAAIAFASAWKAHLEFEGSQFDAMVRSIRLGLQHAEKEDHDSHVRIAMVLANAFMVSGDRDNSQVWFSRARGHAVENGDQASIEALLYNRTAFGISAIRCDRCVESEVQVDLTIARKEVESATNLQELTKISALTNHLQLWSARLSMLEGNFPKAIQDLTISRRGAPFAVYNFSQQMIDLEIVYCLVQVGKVDDALLIFHTIDLASIERLDLDEQLVAASLQCQLEAINVRFSRRGDMSNHFEKLKSEYVGSRHSLRASLNEWAA